MTSHSVNGFRAVTLADWPGFTLKLVDPNPEAEISCPTDVTRVHMRESPDVFIKSKVAPSGSVVKSGKVTVALPSNEISNSDPQSAAVSVIFPVTSLVFR
ncbi:hypothetical protein D3C81_2018710 [compost metagenome]